MDLFNRIDQMTASAETTIKGLAIIVGFFVVGYTLNWFRTVTLGRVVLAVVVAGIVIAVVRKPDLLADDIEKTVALPAVQQTTGLHADAIDLDAGHINSGHLDSGHLAATAGVRL